jgi:hypothetical protein
MVKRMVNTTNSQAVLDPDDFLLGYRNIHHRPFGPVAMKIKFPHRHDSTIQVQFVVIVPLCDLVSVSLSSVLSLLVVCLFKKLAFFV